MASVLLLARKRMGLFCGAAMPFCRSSAMPLPQPRRNHLMGMQLCPICNLSSVPRFVHISFISICASSVHGGYRGMPSSALQKLVANNIFNMQQLLQVRFRTNALVTLDTHNDVVRFSLGKANVNTGVQSKGMKKPKKQKMSRKAKLNELKWYRLKAKKKMKSSNPEVRIRYKLEKAKRKEEWLIEKLRKYEVPKCPEPIHDPEILTEEERFYLKRTGEKKKNYVPVGRRGIFGGVVLNMHLHWKKHETVKVVCKPCKPGQIHEYAEELARLSKGTVIDIKPNNIIIFYRGKNYVRPDVMLPPNTLSKEKALEKYRFEQSLDHTSQFIEKLEQELEEYHKYIALYKNREATTDNIIDDDRE